ncbi:MAG: glycosyltransferase family 4 protein [Actinomycetota bacterium]
MRIALVCPYDWSAPGGVQVHVHELGERLRARDHEVLVLAPSSRPVDDGRVVVCGAPIAIAYNGSTAPIDPRPWRIGEIRAALQRFRPDVVHAHEPLVPNTSMWAVLSSPAPVVATFHSGADRSRLFDAAAPVLRLVARRIDARIAVSERAAAFVRARVPGEYRIVPNGIDASAFAAAPPADLGPGRKVLFVGRLHERKGFPVAVDAFAALAPTYADLRLIVVGAGAQATALDELASGVRERVMMLGTVANRELPPIERACDVFVGASLGGESFGVVLIEAMAAGVPVVASRIPGYDEVVDDGSTGLLVPPGDGGALAAAVARVLDDPALAARLAAAARQHVASRYDWQVVAAELEEVYRSVS